MRKLSFYYGCFLFCVCSPPVFLSRILKINSTLNDAPLLTLLSCDIVWHYDNMTPYWLLMEKVLHQFGVLESVFLEQIIATSAQVTPNGLVRKSIQKGLNSDQGTPLQKNMTMAKSPFWTAWEYIKKNGCVFIVCHVNFFLGGRCSLNLPPLHGFQSIGINRDRAFNSLYWYHLFSQSGLAWQHQIFRRNHKSPCFFCILPITRHSMCFAYVPTFII